MKENRVTNAFGFTVGFDGASQFAPLAVVRLYNMDADSLSIKCRGDVAELAYKRPERVRIDCKDCDYEVGMITRSASSGTVCIPIMRKKV